MLSRSERPEGPDFLCIGAQKAGTTWLYDQLKLHPDVWTPVIKELHYFNFASPHPELAGVEAYPLGPPVSRFRFFWERPSPGTLMWLLRYNYLLRNDEDYRSLFPRSSKVRGEFTPAYSTLDSVGVARVRRTLPEHCKVFFVVRDPIDRAWSAIKMNHRWSKEELDPRDPKTKELFEQPGVRLRSNYSRIIPAWQREFGSRFRVFFYADLVNNPANFLAEVLRYIGADPEWQPEDLHMKSNADMASVPLPQELRDSLIPLFYDDLEFLRRFFSIQD